MSFTRMETKSDARPYFVIVFGYKNMIKQDMQILKTVNRN